MFDLINKGSVPVRDERRDVEDGLKRFKKETGTDFLELLRNKQLRAKMLINGSKNRDTEEDEVTLQKAFGPLQSKCWEDED